ncbi:SDR family NAD(P)-dependent oxidoreductase [Candidatus Poribacteria bacterium]|nr:SDR family NAD(P)-dependent oxidoreductase [Candidatus Poribacteria bacterium]
MLKDKVAIITGASRGIGRATALAFARAGAKVVLAARTPSDLETVVNDIRANGGEVLAVPTDVTQANQVANLIHQTLKIYRQIDILVNNAGIGYFGMVVDFEEADWDSVIGSNLKSVYLCSKCVLKPMLERQSGQIINVLSIAAKVPFKASSAYCAAKAGALALTKVLSEEVRGQNIRVTAVSPGSIHTSFWDGIEGHPDFDLMLKPEHVAETILFVAKQPLGMVIEEITVTPPLGIL